MVSFDLIINKLVIPNDWQKGLIVPIFKGGNEDKFNSDNYQLVSLLFCLMKIFEKRILNRIQSFVVDPKTFPSPLQQGFQRDFICLTASFSLQETIYHNVELNMRVFVAFLDSRKAFDTVWLNALMVKLYNLGICDNLWCIIDMFYSNTLSVVVYFPVMQGIREGGVFSGYLYLVFINDLLKQLGECPFGSRIITINFAPQALLTM